MEAGRLRHRVVVQAKTETRDTHGGVTYSWSTESTRWASVEFLTGRELWQAKQADTLADVRVTMRYYPGLTALHRIMFEGLPLHIDSVANVGTRDIQTVALCVWGGVTSSTSTSTSTSTSSTSSTTTPA